MPARPYHPCTYPGCTELVQTGSRCPVHARKVEQERGSSTRRGYGAEWRKVRDAFLQKHPWCSDPFGDHAAGQLIKATQVDHVLPRSMGGTDEDDNLDGKCDHCHDKKTAKFDGGFGNKKSLTGRGGQNVSNF